MPFTSKIKDITVLSGQTTSNIVPADGVYEGSFGIMVYSPAVLAETGTFDVTDATAPVSGSTWRTLQDDTPADIAVPAAGKSRVYTKLPFANGFRIKLNGAAAADRVFGVTIISN